MILNWLKNLTNDNQKTINRYQAQIKAIEELEPEMKALKDKDFVAKTAELKNRLYKGATLDDLLPEAFALAREAARRKLGLRMYDVQLLAAITFHKGQVAEQKTGEGKTLSAVPALYLNSLTNQGTHLVTVNDYLARRDAGWMGEVFHFLGISVGIIFSGKGEQPAALYDPKYTHPDEHDERLRHLRPVSRQEAYAADITYGTNNEFGFDYLRDNMVHHLKDMVQRGHVYGIVDEVDSILIDEARTPLIISAPDTEPTDKYYQFSQMISDLSPDTDYTVDEKLKTASLTEHGITKIEKKLKVDNLYEKDFEVIHHIENALKARSLYIRDREYVIKEDQIIIVDEFTGRLMYGRRWSEGLHQAVEAKEGVKIQKESKTLATISFQNYFRLYQKLAGMTGTAATEAEEFERIYGLLVVVIPTNQQVQRNDHPDMVYKTTRAKYAAIADEVATLQKKGQPVLIGTTSINKNEVVASLLKRKGLKFNVLNAKNHQQEAQIIADAGRLDAVTIATNIAGRGVDIVLGGAPPEKKNFKDEKIYQKDLKKWRQDHESVIKKGGLFVIGTERHESRRIDNQLRGRSGRQGDPGASRFYVGLDDDIMRIFGGERVARLMDMFKLPEDVPLEHRMVSSAIQQAQVKVEGFHFDSRKRVVEYDDVMNKQREIVYGRRRVILELADTLEEKDGKKNAPALKEKKQTTAGEISKLSGSVTLHEKIVDNLEQDIENLVQMYAPAGYESIEYEQIVREFAQIVPFDLSSQKMLQKDLAKNSDSQKITDQLVDVFHKAYESREKQLGPELMRRIEVMVSLRTIDKLWMEHLDNVNNLRDGIGLRGYGQRDPLVEYKNEAFSMFERLLASVDFEIGRQIMRVQVATRSSMPVQVQAEHPDAATPTAPSLPVEGGRQITGSSGQSLSPNVVTKTFKRAGSKLGRNDPCWCGSGKKFKKCHWPNLGWYKS